MAGQQDYLPSFREGFARCAAESACPELWRGLVGAWAPSLGVTGRTILDWSGFGRTAFNNANASRVSWQASDRGTAIGVNAGPDTSSIAVPTWPTDTTFSIAMLAKRDPMSAGRQTIAADGTAASYGFFINNNDLSWVDASGSFTSSPGGLVAAESWELLGLSARDGAGTFWLNGIACGAATVHSVDVVRIIRDNHGTMRGLVSLVGFWNRPLSAAEWQRLCAEPHCLFAPRRVVYGSASRRPYAAYRRILASAYGVSQ
jgi:hypothetical protein